MADNLNFYQRFMAQFDPLVERAQQSMGQAIGVKDLMHYAATRPSELGLGDPSGGEGDAMRHLLLSAELHRLHPTKAPFILYGHEGINLVQGVPMAGIRQDLYNNTLGKEIAKQSRSRADTERLAMQMMPRTILDPGAQPGSIPWPHEKKAIPLPGDQFSGR